MNRHTARFWTLDTLVGAFVDLFIAYFLLCGSTVALFALKFLGFFGLSYNGLLGSFDLTSLLLDYPTYKVSAVHFSVIRKFPFDSTFFGVHNGKDMNLNRADGDGDGFMQLEGEASCSSKSDARRLVGNGIGDSGDIIDVKGKGSLNYRFRGGFRRRRKASFDSNEHSSSSNWVSCVDLQSNNDDDDDDDDDDDECSEGSSIISDDNNCNYEEEFPMVEKSVSRNQEDTVFGEQTDAQKRIPVNEADKDKMIVLLTRELEEAQVARAALYIELEKERTAAASAADEAMSMILRLQEEKASIKMELRQYQRMIEAKSAYDEQEMNLLKEIVFRREREKHFLEKQVEAYRQMIRVENDQINGGNNQDFIQDPDFMLHQLSINISKKKNSSLYEDIDFLKQEEPEKSTAIEGKEICLEINSSDASGDGEASSRVYDVYAIDNEPKFSEKTNAIKRQNDQKQCGSETSFGLPPVTSKSSLRRNSTSALDDERMRLDTEVEWLRERLRSVQEGREKLNFSIGNQEKESLRLQLLEDIARQLQEIQVLTKPHTARQASLPIPSSKVGSTKKRRCRSVSSGHAKSS